MVKKEISIRENKNGTKMFDAVDFNQVPGTGFEPAHPFERCHLKAVRLPISPPGLHSFNIPQQMYTFY